MVAGVVVAATGLEAALCLLSAALSSIYLNSRTFGGVA